MKQSIPRHVLRKINDWLYEVPKSFRSDMRVPARIFVNAHMLDQILEDNSLWQIVNVATLPGIKKYAMAMADIHEGYGFPIGGVAAMAVDEDGAISPGGIGYDINCGVRLLSSNITLSLIKPKLKELAYRIFTLVPSGVGRSGYLKLNQKDMTGVLEKGARHTFSMGYGETHDIEYCEEQGCFANADPDQVSKRALDRGMDQLGTLGSGNHFLELQVVDQIFDEPAATVFGLQKGSVTAMIHCGSRGLGHQVCTDFVSLMLKSESKWGYHLVDRQLACAPFNSEEGQHYYGAMKAAANFAWANRHIIGHQVRQAWHELFGTDVHLRTVYDVAHNIGKLETHRIDGSNKRLIVHRKGATRAFGPGHADVPSQYQGVGQPVLIPGTMGTASYVLAGTLEGMEESFGSACHGAGRALSRVKAKKTVSGRILRDELEGQGIVVCADSDRGLAEEAPIAYKDVDEVVDVMHHAHLATKVARLRPIAVIKGG